MLALLLAVLWLVFGAADVEGHSSSSPAAAAPATLTRADNGKTVSVPRAHEADLRLPHGWREPVLHGESVQLTPIAYFADPGFDAWKVEPVGRGVTTIASRGPSGRRFRVTIRVS
jgi:hypothetical protein